MIAFFEAALIVKVSTFFFLIKALLQWQIKKNRTLSLLIIFNAYFFISISN